MSAQSGQHRLGLIPNRRIGLDKLLVAVGEYCAGRFKVEEDGATADEGFDETRIGTVQELRVPRD
jgi:hypothetical protein